jgi:hypothetical protein
MSRTIEVSDAVYTAIEKDIKSFDETTPNAVLSRWAKERGLLLSYQKTDSQNETAKQPQRVNYSQRGFHSRRSSPRRIDGFRLFDIQYDVHRWWQLFIKVSEILIQKHSDKVNQLITLRCVHQNAQGLQKAIQIPSTELYYEANYSAVDTIENTYSLLGLMGYHAETNLKIQEHVASADAINLNR